MASHMGVRRVVLADVCPGLDDTLIVGIIIASQSAKTINSKKDNSPRGVWNFTLRDSPEDYINVTVWGSPAFIENCSEEFHIGDVVSVTKARITFRVTGGADDNFRPDVSSQFQLTLSEGTSEIKHHNFPDSPNFLYLMHIPTKQSLDIVPLRDISASNDAMLGSFINILVAVQTVQRARQLKGRNGQQYELREVVVFDQTSSGVSIQLWDKEINYQASQWKPRETILFMADIKMKWDMSREACVPEVTSRTVITVGPQTPEAECLSVYARAAPLHATAIIDHLASNLVDVGSIRNVMSVRSILSRAWADLNITMSNEEQQFTALVYSKITHLDLHHENVLLIKCTSCNSLSSSGNSCSNPECPVEQGIDIFIPKRTFNIRISLSDHTGTLKNCRLTAEAAEAVLGCSVAQFDAMSHNQKSVLSCNFILERCAARVLVLKASKDRRQPVVSMVSCTIADNGEVASRLPLV
ncbi:meiosis-specific with OB domain-containing protein [Thrips palmi]|uniref:Meiosis-specific with OB domain-containing protein n=1 Tax=Thrips palmi TaxID=161013 RepID=A0A6P8YTW0_THRPL|nr:meiosis-specific with OB domain-containing protein [Thrips palmi]